MSTMGTSLNGQLLYMNTSQADVNLVFVVDANFDFPRTTSLIVEDESGRKSMELISI